MVTYKQLQIDRLEAVKEKNTIKKEVITAIMSRAKSIAIDKGADRENISDEIILEAVLKEKKMYKESLEMNTRPTLTAHLLESLEYIDEYAPKEMTEDEVREAVRDILSNGVENMGKAMKLCNTTLKGKADGKLISAIVREEFGK